MAITRRDRKVTGSDPVRLYVEGAAPVLARRFGVGGALPVPARALGELSVLEAARSRGLLWLQTEASGAHVDAAFAEVSRLAVGTGVAAAPVPVRWWPVKKGDAAFDDGNALFYVDGEGVAHSFVLLTRVFSGDQDNSAHDAARALAEMSSSSS